MSPLPGLWDMETLSRRKTKTEVTKPTDPHGLVLEAWAEGYMIGSLIILSCITLANMRRGVLLHKLILLELVLGYWQGFFILFDPPVYAWWLSVAAIFLNASWSLHNVIAWMKIKPFLSRTWSRVFIFTVILVQPYWVVEIYANFTYFHNINDVFLHTRPWEALCRDPWWIATTVFLFYNIKTKYDLSISQIIHISPRFAVMLGAMILSICFIVLDVLSVTGALKNSLPVGINPFWKLSFVFKCLTDAVVLDDFKTALDRLRAFKISRLGSFAIDAGDSRSKKHEDAVAQANSWMQPAHRDPIAVHADTGLPYPSPDGDYVRRSMWEEIKPAPSASHHEQQLMADRARNASRDRDSEENDPSSLADPEAQRGASDAHMLRHQDDWPMRTRPSSNDTGSEFMLHEAESDYAEALREVTHEVMHHPPTQARSLK